MTSSPYPDLQAGDFHPLPPESHSELSAILAELTLCPRRAHRAISMTWVQWRLRGQDLGRLRLVSTQKPQTVNTLFPTWVQAHQLELP